MIAGLYVISGKNTGEPKEVTAYYEGLKSEPAVNATGSVIDATANPATGGVIIVPTIKPDDDVVPTAKPSQTPGVKKNGFVTTAKGKYYYKNGKDVTEHFSYEGCILMCIESLLKQVPTRLIIETLEPAVIYLFPYDKMMQLTKQNWEINMFYRKILEYSLIVSQTKADSWRFESARERYNLLLETHPEIIKRAPLAHIASYLLMTPETLSRVRSGVL